MDLTRFRAGVVAVVARASVLSSTALISAYSAFVAAELPSENASQWELRKESGDIRVYTTEQPGSSFKAFKAEALLDAPIENLMAVMINPQSCEEWVHNCSESYAFGSGDFEDRLAYSINDMPWPVTDRDYVLRIRTSGSLATGEVTMDLNAVPNGRETFDDLIRVDQSDTFYRFVPEGRKTRMTWVQHTDPNGALPGWLVNSLLVDIPIRSMETLEEVAQLPKYQNYQLVYDQAGNLTGVVASKSEGDDS